MGEEYGSLHQQIDINARTKLGHRPTLSLALFIAETGTLRVDHKYLESFEMWCWRRMENVSWTDRVRNGVLHT